MSQESLSALLDGECTAEELDQLLEEMERKPELRQAFSAMCLARELREGTRVRRGQTSICEGVMSRLDPTPAAASPKVVDFAAPGASPRRRQIPWRQLQPYAGMALAASLGALAVLVAVPQAGTDAATGSPLTPAVSSPVSFPLPATRRPRNLQAVSLDPQVLGEDADLDSYLIEHSNTLADRGMGGTLSHAGFSARTAEYRPQPQPAAVIPEDRR